MICTDKERETCNEWKMGCNGCYYNTGDIKIGEYSTYKKEFSNLNNQLRKKDKIIELLVEELADEYSTYEMCRLALEITACDEKTNYKKSSLF